MTSKEKYKIHCEKENDIPIYSQYWWMETICGSENWDVFLAEQDGIIYASMPYYIEKRGSYRYITKAPLTQNNGLWFKKGQSNKIATIYDFEEKMINSAVDYIESLGLDVYEQQYHYTFKNWLPFYWRNYTAITRYTGVIEDTSDIEKVESNFSHKARQNISKAKKIVEICEITPEQFYKVNSLSYARQGLPCPYSYEFFLNLYEESFRYNCGKLMGAVDNQNRLHSGIYFVWDNQAVYPLLGGSDMEFRDSQAYSLITFEGIKLASALNLSYDFEGSVIQRIENFNRSFSPIQKPYFRIRKIFNREIIMREAEEYANRVTKKQ